MTRFSRMTGILTQPCVIITGIVSASSKRRLHAKSFHDAGTTVIVEARYSGTYKATGKSPPSNASASTCYENRPNQDR
jgi:hypothetical protein